MRHIFCILMFVASIPAWACSCLAWPSAKDAWQSSPVVFIGLVEQAKPNKAGDRSLGEQTVLARVDSPFKGAKRDQVFTLEQPGHNCAPKFAVGERVLFYLHPSKKPAVWEAHGCHRTRSYARASDDLLFLQRLPASAVGNRLSGEVELYENGPQGFRKVRSLHGVKVTVTPHEGPPTTTTTNADGVYELYGLPAGDYEVGIEVPKGMHVYFSMMTGRRFFPSGLRSRREAKRDGIHLDPESGVSVDYLLMSNTK